MILSASLKHLHRNIQPALQNGNIKKELSFRSIRRVTFPMGSYDVPDHVIPNY